MIGVGYFSVIAPGHHRGYLDNGAFRGDRGVGWSDGILLNLTKSARRLIICGMGQNLTSPENSKLYDELRERLRFETLIADVSSIFVNLPAADVDREIREAQRLFCELLGLDLAGFWQWSDEVGGSFKLTHLYRIDQGPELPEPMIAREHFPWVEQQMLAGRIVAFSSLEELPAEAARDLEVSRQLGIKSNLTLPLSVGGEPPLGALGFNTIRAERDWPAPLVKRLQLVAQIFANALARKRAELALRESAERLSLTTDSAEVGLWVLDCRTHVFWASEKARTIFGYSPDEPISMERFKASVHPDDWPIVQATLERSMHAGETLNVEYRIRLGGGRTRWITSRGRPTFLSSGEPQRLTGVSLDITEPKRIAEQQAEDLRFVTLIAELSSQFVNLEPGEVDGAIQETQRRVCEILGLDLCTLWQWQGESRELLSMTHIHGVLAAPLPAQFDADDYFPWCRKEILAGRTIVVSHPDALGPEATRDVESWRHFGAKSSVVFPLSTGGAPSIGALAFSSTQVERDWPAALVERLQLVAQIFANALARKLADQALRNSEVRMATGAELAGIGYYEVDFTEPSCFIDERFHEICGIAPGRQPGLQPLQEWMENLHPADRSRILEVRRELHEGRIERLSTEYRYMHPVEGQKWIHHVARVAKRDAAGHTLRSYGVIRDITSRKLAEKEAQELRENLAHLARVNTLGALSGSLAHELNQPLGIILSNTQAAQELLAQDPPDLAEVQAILADIVAADRRAGEVIRRLREMLKRGEVSLCPILLNEIIDEVLHLTHSDLIGRGITVVRDLAADLPPIAGDRVQLQQLMLNLILNGADAMAGKESGTRRLHFQTMLHEGRVHAGVRDEGVGLPADTDRLFQPFYTTKPHGLGLGLSICQAIVTAHHGRLWAEPHPDGGAVFRFELPIAASSVKP